ncbi:carbohydrate ABC transporter permease [Vallitalea pronyensis]|nr:sugar ABC transporter permease [Vallitalea pronyensis]
MKTKKKKNLEKQNIGYLLVAPSFLIYLLFIMIPVVWSVAMSFTDYNLVEANFVGFKNYINLFQDDLFVKGFMNTLRYSAMTIVPTMALGLGLAMLLNKKLKGKGLYRTWFYLPNIFSMVAISMAWIYLYDTRAGILNMALRKFGIGPVQWVSSPGMAMISIAIMSIWIGVGYNMVLNLAGLQSIPEYLYEAASIDGAHGWQKFIYITIPMLAPTTFFIFVMACIRSFQVFGQVLIVTNGGPVNSTTTLAHQIYLNGFEYYKMGYASSQAVVLLVVILTITLVNMRYGKGGETDAN